MIRLTKNDYDKLTKKNRVHNTRKARAIHAGHTEADIDGAYHTAVQTLRDLQVYNGSLFLGRSKFTLWPKIVSDGQSDGANVYKGIEDGLNKIAYYDDKQNITFKRACLCSDSGGNR